MLLTGSCPLSKTLKSLPNLASCCKSLTVSGTIIDTSKVPNHTEKSTNYISKIQAKIEQPFVNGR